jgi:hypothetical protein
MYKSLTRSAGGTFDPAGTWIQRYVIMEEEISFYRAYIFIVKPSKEMKAFG